MPRSGDDLAEDPVAAELMHQAWDWIKHNVPAVLTVAGIVLFGFAYGGLSAFYASYGSSVEAQGLDFASIVAKVAFGAGASAIVLCPIYAVGRAVRVIKAEAPMRNFVGVGVLILLTFMVTAGPELLVLDWRDGHRTVPGSVVQFYLGVSVTCWTVEWIDPTVSSRFHAGDRVLQVGRESGLVVLYSPAARRGFQLPSDRVALSTVSRFQHGPFSSVDCRASAGGSRRARPG